MSVQAFLPIFCSAAAAMLSIAAMFVNLHFVLLSLHIFQKRLHCNNEGKYSLICRLPHHGLHNGARPIQCMCIIWHTYCTLCNTSKLDNLVLKLHYCFLKRGIHLLGNQKHIPTVSKYATFSIAVTHESYEFHDHAMHQ